MSSDEIFDDPTVFRCPGCKETINVRDSQCPHCHKPIDPEHAQDLAQWQRRYSNALSDAYFLRNVQYALVVCTFLTYCPIIACFSNWVWIILFIIVPCLVIRWHIRHGGLDSQEEDYISAKKNKNLAVIFWLLCLVVPVAISLLFGIAGVVLNIKKP